MKLDEAWSNSTIKDHLGFDRIHVLSTIQFATRIDTEKTDRQRSVTTAIYNSILTSPVVAKKRLFPAGNSMFLMFSKDLSFFTFVLLKVSSPPVERNRFSTKSGKAIG